VVFFFEIVFGKKAFGLFFSIGVLFLPRPFRLPFFLFSLAFIKPENVVIRVSHVRPCVP
jgi:hypothetical protein